MARQNAAYDRFRKRLRLARERAGLSQAEALRRLGKRDRAYVWKSEVGERRVDAIELGEFAKVYDVPITFFFE